MTKLTAAEAKEILLQNEIENAEFIENLDWTCSVQGDAEFYTMDGALIMAGTFRGEAYTDIAIPVGETFNLASVCTWAAENRGNSRISISVGQLSDSEKASVKEMFANTHNFTNASKNYRFTGEPVSAFDEHIRFITAEDQDAFIGMEFTKEPNRPTQEILFDHFIVSKREDGAILGYFEDGKLLGYLPYLRLSENSFENDYIWVAPSKRKQGIGGKLTDAFVAAILAKGCTPIWSSPWTEISAHLAETHGFTVLSETMYFKAK